MKRLLLIPLASLQQAYLVIACHFAYSLAPVCVTGHGVIEKLISAKCCSDANIVLLVKQIWSKKDERSHRPGGKCQKPSCLNRTSHFWRPMSSWGCFYQKPSGSWLKDRSNAEKWTNVIASSVLGVLKNGGSLSFWDSWNFDDPEKKSKGWCRVNLQCHAQNTNNSIP